VLSSLLMVGGWRIPGEAAGKEDNRRGLEYGMTSAGQKRLTRGGF